MRGAGRQGDPSLISLAPSQPDVLFYLELPENRIFLSMLPLGRFLWRKEHRVTDSESLLLCATGGGGPRDIATSLEPVGGGGGGKPPGIMKRVLGLQRRRQEVRRESERREAGWCLF